MTESEHPASNRKGWFKPFAIDGLRNKKPPATLLSFIWLMSGRHQVGLCVLAVIVSLLITAPIELHRRIIEDGIEARDINALTMLAIAYVVLTLLGQAAKLALRVYQSWISESAIYNARHYVSEMHVSDTAKQDEDGGAAVSIMGQEVDKLGGFVGDGLSAAAANIAILLAVIGYMLIVEPSIAVFALAFLIPQVALTPVIQNKLNELIETRVQLMRDMSDELISPDESKDTLPDHIRNIYRNRLHFLALKFAMKTALNLLNAAGPMVVLIYGGYLAIEGETTLGILVAFLTGFDKLANPMRELISFYRMAAQAKVQHAMIAEWMQPEKDGRDDAKR